MCVLQIDCLVCVDVICTFKISKKDGRDHHLTEIGYPLSVGLSQHSSAISSLIIANWLLRFSMLCTSCLELTTENCSQY